MPGLLPPFVRHLCAGGTLLGAAWAIHAHWIAPLDRRISQLAGDIAATQEQIQGARHAIQKIKAQEQANAQSRRQLNASTGDLPGAPVEAWFPPKLRTHLLQFGITEAVIRLNTKAPEPCLSGYERTYWRLGLPAQHGVRTISTVVHAVAEIEEQDPFTRIVDFSVRSDPMEPDAITGGVNLTALVRR
jgi:hypothetical protein